MTEMNNEMNNKCPGCGRHCDLSAPSCPRGEAFARGERPEEGRHGMERKESGEWREHRGRNEEHARRDGRGHREEHRHEPFEDGEFRGGREPHREHRRSMEAEEYQALDTDGKLNALLHELRHMSRFGTESRGGQSRVLKILAEEGSMTQRSLTEKLGVQPGSASEVIGKLERAGFIARRENAEDRRTADVSLTEAGREQVGAKREENPDLFSSLNGEEKDQLLALLEKLRADWREKFPRERRGRDGHPAHEGRHGPGKDGRA